MMYCLQCGKPLAKGYEVRRLSGNPVRLRQQDFILDPFCDEELMGHVCTPEHGRMYLDAQRGTRGSALLRLVLSLQTPCVAERERVSA